MRSLSAHLRQPGSHGHLPFHAGCSNCRAERLAGSPPGDALLSARSRAGLAAALLAATSAPAAPALAGEADTEQEGATEDGAPAGETDPGFGEGTGGDTDLPVDDGTDLPPTGDDDAIEQAPERESIRSESDPEGPASVPEPPAVPAPGPSPTPITAPPEVPALEDLRAPPRIPPDRREHGPAQRTLPLQTPGPPPSAPRPGAQTRETEPPATRTAPTPTAAGPAVADKVRSARAGERTDKPRPTRPSGRTHVVRQGECLWSIAHDQLGGGATPAQVARLVNRLWERNRDRIGTGEPDLLMAGTELQLP